MLIPLVVALLQAAPQAPAPSPATAHVMTARDSSRARRDSARTRRENRPAKRLEVTAEHLATAFKDPASREILLLARRARTTQDSALQSYDATTYQRMSAGMGFTKFGRDRLAFRTEEATKVQWRRGVGAYVRMGGSISPIPYYPGSETLWIGSGAAKGTVDENQGIVHPLAEGSEAYYTYSTGDSVTFRLPDGKSIRLRELQVRPRTPKWNLAVGSLWFDLSGGQLVRTA
jgi:hypothetical protein